MANSNEHTRLLQYDNLQIPDSQVVLIYTEWNEKIVQELLRGAKQILTKFPQIKIHEICVPGAVEIPFIIQQFHQYHAADVYIALGCVIRGETPHFDMVCSSLVQGITQLNLTLNNPVIFGVLTVNTIEQAYDRLGGSQGHKGEEAAITAIKMLALTDSLKSRV